MGIEKLEIFAHLWINLPRGAYFKYIDAIWFHFGINGIPEYSCDTKGSKLVGCIG